MVSRPSPFPYLLPVLIGFILSSCAVPQAPTGGPRDEEPPRIVESRPPAQATNVSPQSITLTFSEYVERSSFEQAITTTPSFEDDLTFDWSGQTVTVHFPEPLYENTTHLITLRTELQDQHGVRLEQPITIAFSTGPEINKHTLAGRIVQASNEEGIPDFDVFAYRPSPDSLVDPRTTAPTYRTQTDERGRFVLEYLPDTTFFVAGVSDQNRNYRPDPNEMYAVPPQPRIHARPPDAPDSTVTLIATRLDTVAPRLRAAQSPSRQQVQLSFNEPVRLESTRPEWSLTPTTGSTSARLEIAYWREAAPQNITLLTDELDSLEYRLALSGQVTDTSYNVVEDTVVTFSPSSSPDTVTAHVEQFLPPAAETPYPAARRPGLRLNRPLLTHTIDTHAAVSDIHGRVISGTWQTNNGTEYRFFPDQSLALADTITLTVQPELADGDSTVYHPIIYFEDTSYGSISGTISPANSSTIVTASPPDGADTLKYTTRTDSTGRFHVRRIPEGSYGFHAFRDDNANGRWDGGQLYPYKPAEPVMWRDSVRVRARWETDLDTLHAPSFRTIPNIRSYD